MPAGTFLPPGLTTSDVKITSGGTDNYVMTAVDGETIQGEENLTFDGSDLTLGNNIGIVFGDAGEKIEGDGTHLTIASSSNLTLTAGNVNITPTGDMNLTAGNFKIGGSPAGVGKIRLENAATIGWAGASSGQKTFGLNSSDKFAFSADIDLGDNDLLNVGASGNDWTATNLEFAAASSISTAGGALTLAPITQLVLSLNDADEYLEWIGGTAAKVTTGMTTGRIADFTLAAQNVAASATIDIVTFNSASAFANQKGVLIDGWAQDGTSAIYFRLVVSRRYGGDTDIVLLEQENFNTTSWMAVGDWTIADASGDDVKLSYTNNESGTVAIQLSGKVFG